MTQPGISPAINIFALLMQIASCSVHAAAGTHFLSAASGELPFSSVSPRQNCKCALSAAAPCIYIGVCAWQCTRCRGLSCMLLAARAPRIKSNVVLPFRLFETTPPPPPALFTRALNILWARLSVTFLNPPEAASFKWELALCSLSVRDRWVTERASKRVSAWVCTGKYCIAKYNSDVMREMEHSGAACTLVPRTE